MMINKGTDAWASDPGAFALRVELSSEHSLLLPFDQFVYAEIRQAETEQRLQMVFATHEVVVQGHSLRRVVAALQRRELAVIALLSDPQRAGILDGQPLIRRIVVTETKTTPPTESQTP